MTLNLSRNQSFSVGTFLAISSKGFYFRKLNPTPCSFPLSEAFSAFLTGVPLFAALRYIIQNQKWTKFFPSYIHLKQIRCGSLRQVKSQRNSTMKKEKKLKRQKRVSCCFITARWKVFHWSPRANVFITNLALNLWRLILMRERNPWLRE
jgi:hypothetical protein